MPSREELERMVKEDVEKLYGKPEDLKEKLEVKLDELSQEFARLKFKESQKKRKMKLRRPDQVAYDVLCALGLGHIPHVKSFSLRGSTEGLMVDLEVYAQDLIGDKELAELDKVLQQRMWLSYHPSQGYPDEVNALVGGIVDGLSSPEVKDFCRALLDKWDKDRGHE